MSKSRGCIRNGISRMKRRRRSSIRWSHSREYAFNKSHAAAYAVLAYETGVSQKVHYPVEFMAALMTSVMGDSDADSANTCGTAAKWVSKYCRLDVNEERARNSLSEDGKIRFGLLGVKNRRRGRHRRHHRRQGKQRYAEGYIRLHREP